jgi:serine phosphatase RsbU (regulator of sigma subunit)
VEGGATRLRWSNAGHPPPIVIAPDGEVSVLTVHEADLLLGLDPGTPRTTTSLDLAPGTTVLLYTDGLVERRGQSIDEGLSALHDTLVDLTGEGVTLDELCDTCLRRLLPPDAEDDAALVAVRLLD